jgi:hypothetical protein
MSQRCLTRESDRVDHHVAAAAHFCDNAICQNGPMIGARADRHRIKKNGNEAGHYIAPKALEKKKDGPPKGGHYDSITSGS